MKKQGFILQSKCDFIMETEIHNDHIYKLSIV